MYEKKFGYVSKVGLLCKRLLSVAYIFKRALSLLHLLIFFFFSHLSWATMAYAHALSILFRNKEVADRWRSELISSCPTALLRFSVSSDFFFCIFCVLSQVFTKWTSDTAMEVFSLGFIPVTWLLLFLSGASCFSFALLFLFCLDPRICSAP